MDREQVFGEENEQKIGGDAVVLSNQIGSLVIDSADKFFEANTLLRAAKTMQSRIKKFWEPLIQKAKEPYDDLRARQKTMLAPVDYAEKMLKEKISVYKKEQDEIARQKALEEEQKKQAAIDKKMEEAAALEASGNVDDADYALAEAEFLSDLSPAPVASAAPKVDGVSYRTMYKLSSIEVIDPTKVPIFFDGVEIRPVDISAILKLVKAKDGNVEIPGIKITPEMVTVARSY